MKNEFQVLIFVLVINLLKSPRRSLSPVPLLLAASMEFGFQEICVSDAGMRQNCVTINQRFEVLVTEEMTLVPLHCLVHQYNKMKVTISLLIFLKSDIKFKLLTSLLFIYNTLKQATKHFFIQPKMVTFKVLEKSVRACLFSS